MQKQPIFPRHQQTPAPSISDFTKIATLGAGNFGTVGHYRHLQTSNSYAIKTMNIKNYTPKQISMIKKQLEMLYKTRSEYVVQLQDHFEDNQHVYLMTEFIDGKDLYKGVFKSRKLLSLETVARIGFELSSALEQLHKNNIIHRDIKLQNIVMTKEGRIKVVDFGCSNYYGDQISRKTAIGTKPYWCPQLLNGEKQDDRLDVWCMGIIIYELVFLESPFIEPDMFGKIRSLKYKIPADYYQTEPQLVDFLKRTISYRNQRMRAYEAKCHPFIKKYCAHLKSNQKLSFQLLFDYKNVQQYRAELLAQIDRWRKQLEVIREGNEDVKQMVENNQREIKEMIRKKKENKNTKNR